MGEFFSLILTLWFGFLNMIYFCMIFLRQFFPGFFQRLLPSHLDVLETNTRGGECFEVAVYSRCEYHVLVLLRKNVALNLYLTGSGPSSWIEDFSRMMLRFSMLRYLGGYLSEYKFFFPNSFWILLWGSLVSRRLRLVNIVKEVSATLCIYD